MDRLAASSTILLVALLASAAVAGPVLAGTAVAPPDGANSADSSTSGASGASVSFSTTSATSTPTPSGSDESTPTEPPADTGGSNETVPPGIVPSEPEEFRDPFAAGKLSDSARKDDVSTLVVEATDPGAVNLTALGVAGTEVVGRHGRFVEIRAAPGRVGRLRALPWVRLVRRPHPTIGTSVAEQTTSEGVAVLGADDLHEAGITGENVTVGVIDTGFRPASPEIADRVATVRNFRLGGTTRRSTHGTAVAELVVDTAPNATLYLATFRTGVGYRNAVKWLEGEDVDVIVTSIGFYTQPGDGTGRISEAAAGAVERGTVWVNAAGNAAGTHWEGRFADGNHDGIHEFAPGDELNELNGGRPLPADSTVSVVLKWNDWPASGHDYDLVLLRRTTDGPEVVAGSTVRQDGARAPFETVSHRVSEEAVYAFAIRRVDAPGRATLEAFVSYRGVRPEPLEHDTPESSLIAPATAPGVIGVGAFDVRDGRLEGFSSRGPTDDGRLGVDVIGPDQVSTRAYDRRFAGTSAAAPHVAGSAALLLSADRSLSPSAVTRVLRTTATDVGSPGPDPATGGGRVHAGNAVDAVARNRSAPPDVADDGRPATDPDGDGLYEDVNGDGAVTPGDATVLFDAVFGDDPAVVGAPERFDFSGDGAVTPGDATALFDETV